MKFDKNLNNKINRTFRNFNRKQQYHHYKTKGRGELPSKVNVKEWKAKYSDKPRKEIERQLKIYQSFSERDALDRVGVNNRLAKWQLSYFQQNLEKTQQFYDQEIADLKRIIGNKPQYHLRLHSRLQELISNRKDLNKDFTKISDSDIEHIKSVFNYAERSELVKEQGFRTYLNQLDRAMDALGYSKNQRDALFNKFNVLSENEFTEMVRREDLINAVYYLINSPKGRGKYELMADEAHAREIIESIEDQADLLVNKYKTKK